MDDGIWVTGKCSKNEMALVQNLLRQAIKKFGKGELPFQFTNQKITFKAEASGKNIHVFYGWNYPPKHYWVQGVKSNQECSNCFPNGKEHMPQREAWCQKQDYNFPTCPYGVLTSQRAANKL